MIGFGYVRQLLEPFFPADLETNDESLMRVTVIREFEAGETSSI
jgi:hypothetical protein